MAKILETTRATGSTPTKTTGRHAGLTLRPAQMVSSNTTPGAYTRAARIRKGYLCENLGLPDPSQITAREGEVGDLSNMSTRDKLTTMTNSPACISCHSKLNPVGFALEGLDSWGMARTLETRFDAAGKVIATYPVQTAVGNPYLRDQSGVDVTGLAGAEDLRAAVANTSAVKSCFAQRLFEFQRTTAFVDQDLCALSDMEKAARSGTIQDVFIQSVVNDDIFWRAKGN